MASETDNSNLIAIRVPIELKSYLSFEAARLQRTVTDLILEAIQDKIHPNTWNEIIGARNE